MSLYEWVLVRLLIWYHYFFSVLKSSGRRLLVLFRWMILAGISGSIIGFLAAWFGRCIIFVTALRQGHPWMIFLLPLFGLIIAAIYRLDKLRTSTNLIFEGISANRYIPVWVAPMIAAATILTHAGGGSAGREGAALQFGGSIGGSIADFLKLDEGERKIMIMVGMCSAFSALFGTPLTAALFAIEVVSVGIMEYSALIPCTLASFSAGAISELAGMPKESFHLPSGIEFTLPAASKIIILGILIGLLSLLFCQLLHKVSHVFSNHIHDPFLRIFCGGLLVILLSMVLGTTDYLGTGMSVIEEAIDGKVFWAAFLLKMLFSAITLGSGYKGGEIVPTLFLGATFGSLFGSLCGLPASICAACGMTAAFAGVTNCPISALFLSFELFGLEYLPFYAFTISVSYMISGYYSLYHSQRIFYSKTAFGQWNPQGYSDDQSQDNPDRLSEKQSGKQNGRWFYEPYDD